MAKSDSARRQIGELQDEIKHRDRRIEELRREIDEQRELIRRMEEHVEDASNVIERWKETFDMVETEDGAWTWEPFWDAHNDLLERYNDLVRRWNKYVPALNRNPVGRPLEASAEQRDTVRRLRKRGMSLRAIVDETSLSFQTVRTIVGKGDGSDRTSRKHRGRIEVARQEMIRRQRQKRTGDALPRQAQAVVEAGRELVKEAKGLK